VYEGATYDGFGIYGGSTAGLRRLRRKTRAPMKTKTTAAPPMETPAIAPGLSLAAEDAGVVETAEEVPVIPVVWLWEELVM
jgi:hypothetical protein